MALYRMNKLYAMITIIFVTWCLYLTVTAGRPFETGFENWHEKVMDNYMNENGLAPDIYGYGWAR